MKTKQINRGRMKSIMLLVAFFSFVGTMSVKAATGYGVYIAGTEITSSNYSSLANIDRVSVGTGGRIYFDSSSNTLYMRNVNIYPKDKIGIENRDCYNLKIVFEEYYDSEGTNKGCWIQSTNKEAVLLKTQTTFTSQGVGYGVFSSSKSADLSINSDEWVTISNTDIYCQGSNIGIKGNSVGKIQVANSILCVWGGESIPAVENLNCLIIRGTSNVTLYGNDATQTVIGLSSFSLDEDMAISSPSGAYFLNPTFRNSGSAIITGNIEIKTTAVRINSTNFPDGNFRSYVSSNFDTSGDGYLIKQEIRNATYIIAGNKSISNLKGIEYLTSLQALACNNNNLTSIDLSKNTSLTSLVCDNNKLTSLDMSYNKELLSLSCSGNVNLSSIYLNYNTKLTKLYCTGCKSLTSLYLSNNTALQELNCHNCTNLVSITMGTHNSLKMVDCSNDDLTVRNIYFNMNKYIVGKLPSVSSGTFNTTLYISKDDVNKAQNKGWSVNTVGMNVYELNATNFPDANFRNYIMRQSYYDETGWVFVEKPTEMNVEGMGISNLTGIGLFTNLQKLWCGNNRLTSLDMSKNKKLFYLGCPNNFITSLNLSGLTELYTLNCRNNSLSSLSVSSLTNLENLYCDGNNISSLNFNGKLKIINCSNNRLTFLHVNNLDNLTTFDCSYNQITSLLLPKNNTALQTVHCEGNQVKDSYMSNTVNSLPTVSSGDFYVSTSTSSEGNVMNQAQLAMANKKGWKVWQKDTGDKWKLYVVNGITTGEALQVTSDKIQATSEGWYTIDGRKINGKPTKKGVYIRNGKAVVN